MIKKRSRALPLFEKNSVLSLPSPARLILVSLPSDILMPHSNYIGPLSHSACAERNRVEPCNTWHNLAKRLVSELRETLAEWTHRSQPSLGSSCEPGLMLPGELYDTSLGMLLERAAGSGVKDVDSSMSGNRAEKERARFADSDSRWVRMRVRKTERDVGRVKGNCRLGGCMGWDDIGLGWWSTGLALVWHR